MLSSAYALHRNPITLSTFYIILYGREDKRAILKPRATFEVSVTPVW